MSIEKEGYQEAIKAAQRLSREQRRQLIEELSRDLNGTVTPLALTGTWKGVSLSVDEIDKARRECWAKLGEDE